MNGKSSRFNAESALQNLQAYQIATREAVAKQYLLNPTIDEGSAFGELIASASKPKPRKDTETNQTVHRKRDNSNDNEDKKTPPKKRRTQKQKQTDSSTTQRLLPMIDFTSLLSATKTDTTHEHQSAATLGLVSNYSSSDESERETTTTVEQQVSEDSDDEPIVERSESQRFAVPGEPLCVVCGRFGQYVCAETECDVCSIECKQKHLNEVSIQREREREDSQKIFSAQQIEHKPHLTLPEDKPDQWNHRSYKWKLRHSSLESYKCWKCGKVGHLGEDCTAFMNVPTPLPTNPEMYYIPQQQQKSKPMSDGSSSETKHVYSPLLRKMYKKCKEIGSTPGRRCATCGVSSNLVYCLSCDSVFCDGRNHLIEHLIQNPGHTQLYSFKLRRQIKCCNAACEEMNVYKLKACAQCLDKNFDRHYSLVTATWSKTGLIHVANAVCCDQHFRWHEMNCLRSGGSECVVEREKLYSNYYKGLLSEHLF